MEIFELYEETIMWFEIENSSSTSTCVNPLPAHSERSSGLNEVIGNGAAVVSAGAPRQLGRAVCHFLHSH